MNVRYIVELSEAERDQLEGLLRGGCKKVRVVKRAQILLASTQSDPDEELAANLATSTSTIRRTRKRFVLEGLDAALSERERPGARRKLTGREEAILVAVACSRPPPGRAKWTLELLGDELVRLTEHETVSKDTVRRRLHEKEIKPWRHKMWCIPSVDAEFVARMEDVLDLYATDHDPRRPVVCFDEKPYQLVDETRVPVRPKPGQPGRIDYEYRRAGTANIFVCVGAQQPWRAAKVTSRRTNIDFAEFMRDLVDVHLPDAEKIVVVMDNLSTHRDKNLYEAFPPEEARRILRKLEFHYTPKHASWLNMAEIEIGVLSSQCLDRRIPDQDLLSVEVQAWVAARNDAEAGINWMFDVHAARAKLGRAYPSPLHQPETALTAT